LSIEGRIDWKNDRLFENRVKLIRGEREVDDVSDCRDKNRCTFLEKPSGDIRSEPDYSLRQLGLGRILMMSDAEEEKSGVA